MSSVGEDVFLTQTKEFESNNIETDGVLSDILDMEGVNNDGTSDNTVDYQADFTLKSDIFSDISDDDLIKASQIVENKTTRFCAPMQESDLEQLVKDGLSKKTENKTQWALRVFQNWQKERLNVSSTNNAIKTFHKNVLEMSNEQLNESLGYFVAEVRKLNGDEYKPNTVYELVIAIQHYLRENKRFVNFLDDVEFESMRRVLDAKMKNLSRLGLGIEKKKAEIISEEQENEMWEKGILGTDTAQKLLDTLVFQLGLHFALRAGQEHRNLRCGILGQIKVKVDVSGNKYLEYREDISKTNAGGLLHRQLQPKVTRAYANNNQPERCPVRIYEKYISLRPNDSKSNNLYLHPLKYPTAKCWYSDSPVGVHQLQRTVSKLCQNAGFKGFYTNHSLRATAATRLYNAGLDEQLVAEKTGHRSNAVRSYKRTCDNQLMNVSNILQCGSSSVQCASKKMKLDVNEKANVSDEGRQLCVNSGNVSFTLKF